MALMINEVLRKIILASRLEFLLLCFLVENYGTLLLAESDTTEKLSLSLLKQKGNGRKQITKKAKICSVCSFLCINTLTIANYNTRKFLKV